MTRHSSGPDSQMNLAAVAVALTIFFLGCGTTTPSGTRPGARPPCSDVYRALGLGPSPAALPGRCMAQHLAVTGEVKGAISSALVQPCRRPSRGDPEPVATLDVVLADGFHYQLTLRSDASYNRPRPPRSSRPSPTNHRWS